jgi:hypothetical protein
MKHTTKRRIRNIFVIDLPLLFLLLLPVGCTTVFSELQSARLVEEGKHEVTTTGSLVESEGNRIESHFGLQVARGISEKTNIRFRYEHVNVPEPYSLRDGSITAEVISAGLKVGLVKNRMAIYFPVGLAFIKDVDITKTFQFHPTLLVSLPLHKNFEANTSFKAILRPFREDKSVCEAFNLGLGISGEEKKWVLRPEVGWYFKFGEDNYFTHFSLGFTWYQ